ncbi:MAG: hypothetical protein CNE95_07495 [Puniceicoccaceae bacterium MED-G30]|nr:MAG: hypothetical protein CNE95_07495 [Puniceicoccaceae bacterium MED-G30]RPG83314.1 MAG: hypothetical protein CBC33_009365 [Coraliomargarita sp. TMED73]
MRISHAHKFIFFATPRTGSTTVRDVLDEYSDIASVHITEVSSEFPFYHHISPLELKAIFMERGWEWDSYRKFCFVRNPYDRVVSLYHHFLRIRKENKLKGVKGLLWRLRYLTTRAPSFRQYVMRLNSSKRLPTTLPEFVGDGEGRLMVDTVLKYEELAESLPECLMRYGLDVDAQNIPHLNASARERDYRKYYDSTLKKKVQELYQYEFKEYGYEF